MGSAVTWYSFHKKMGFVLFVVFIFSSREGCKGTGQMQRGLEMGGIGGQNLNMCHQFIDRVDAGAH